MNSFFFKLRRTTMFMFLLVMPIGVRIDPQHPNEFSISAHGGTGQVVSVIRDCDGNALTRWHRQRLPECAGESVGFECGPAEPELTGDGALGGDRVADGGRRLRNGTSRRHVDG